jgi:hypothetical protein
MTGSRVYRRHLGEDVPADAVVVAIGGASDNELTVSVVNPEKGDVPADEEAQRNVHSALEYADSLCRKLHQQEVLIAIENPALWRPEWGTLA